MMVDPAAIDTNWEDFIDALSLGTDLEKKLVFIAKAFSGAQAFSTDLRDHILNLDAAEIGELRFLETFNEVDAVVVSALPSAEQQALLENIAYGLDGRQARDAEDLSLAYTTISNCLMIPAALTQPNLVYRGEGAKPDAMDAAAWDAMTPGNPPAGGGILYVHTGIDFSDFGKFATAGPMYKVGHWSHYQGLNGVKAMTDYPKVLKVRSIATVAALNINRCGGNAYLASRAAVALCLGLWNIGRDGLNREWTVVDGAPTQEAIGKVMQFFVGPDSPLYMRSFYDSIAFVGFVRLSNTHLYVSKETDADKQTVLRTLRLVHAISEYLQGTVARVMIDAFKDDEKKSIALWSSCHAWSLCGAVGFFLAYRNSPGCSPYLTARDNVLGDLFKPDGICVKGFGDILTAPMLSVIANIKTLKVPYDLIVASHKQAVETPVRSTSNAIYLTNLGSFPVSAELAAARLQIGAVVTGALTNGIVAQSLSLSYFLRGLVDKMPGHCFVWQKFFEKIQNVMDDVSLAYATNLLSASHTEILKLEMESRSAGSGGRSTARTALRE